MRYAFFRLLALILTVCVLAAQSWAQEPSTPLAPLDTASPRATYGSLLEQGARIGDALRAYRAAPDATRLETLYRAVHRAGALFDLSAVPEALREETAGAAVAYLRDILVRLEPLALESIPGGDDLPPRWRRPGTAIEIVRVGEGASAEYLFSAETVVRLPEDHSVMIHEPIVQPSVVDNWHAVEINLAGPAVPQGLVAALPPEFRAPLFGTPAWKVALTVLLWLAGLFAVLPVARAAGAVARDTGPVRLSLARLAAPTALCALTFFGIGFANDQINVSGAFGLFALSVATVTLAVGLAWTAWVAASLLVEALIASPLVAEHGYDAHLLRLLGRVGGAVAATAALVWGADAIGVPVLGVVAGVSVSGLALALAAQSTIENLFGGLSVFADRPFRIGEFIRFGSDMGTVEAIGPRSARIRGLDGTLTAIPNADLAKMHVVNFSRRNHCQIVQTIGLRYDTPPETVAVALRAIRDAAAAHEWVAEDGGLPRARLIGFGPSAIEIELRANVTTRDYGTFLEVQEAVLLDVMRAVEKAGAAFAFPTRTVVIEQASPPGV